MARTPAQMMTAIEAAIRQVWTSRQLPDSDWDDIAIDVGIRRDGITVPIAVTTIGPFRRSAP